MCREPQNILLSPIQHIPAEILSRFFLECLPAGEPTLLEPSAHNAPLLVSAICSEWRQIALSTPHLWNSIYLCFDDMASSNDKWNTQAVRGDTRLDMEMTKLWISRARAVPVSIRLECSVGWRNTYIPPTPKMVTDLLAVAQISTLILGIELSVQHCVEILSCCSQIINCSFLQVTLSSDVPIIVRNPIALRRLRSLWLRTNGDLGLLFSHITLPRLTTLSVEYLNPWDGDFWPQPEFASLVSRSACSLQKLRIHRVTMTSDKLTACLSCAPSITQVSIIDRADGLDDALLTAMTAKPNSQPLNPRLEVIRFSGRAYADKVLVNMIESRWRPGKALTATTSQTSSHVSRLKVVRVRVRAKLGDSWQRLQKFHTEGLDTMGSDVDVISS